MTRLLFKAFDVFAMLLGAVVTVPPCDICGKEQSKLGGIEYGPPEVHEGYPGVYCRKLHVFTGCSRVKQVED
jgi:hypothetical protein